MRILRFLWRMISNALLAVSIAFNREMDQLNGKRMDP